MKSAYAPLPFSYLSSDAKPRVGLRKDGVYGTSADVPRFHQPDTQDQTQHYAGNNISMSTEDPYNVYSNANALHPGAATDFRGNLQHQQTMPTKAPSDHPIYSQDDGPQRFQESNPYRPHKPEGVYPPSKYENPYVGRITPKEEDPERKYDPSNDYGLRGPTVVTRPQEQNRSNAGQRVPSYYPPVGNNANKQQVYEMINGVELPSTEAKQKQPTAVVSKDFDNFILVKDPNRPDSVVVPEPIPSANNHPRRTNNLQTLFEADEPRKQQQQPPAMHSVPPSENHYESEPSRTEVNTRRNQDQSGGLDRPSHAIYHGPQQLGPQITTAGNPEPPNYRDNRAFQPDTHRSSDVRLVKDSEAERKNGSSRGCACGKCSAVVIAVIVTAIICLGAGFVAGWFGAKAAGSDTPMDSSSSPTIFANLSTVTVGKTASSTELSAILSTKVSATSSSTTPSAILTTKASAVSTTGSRVAISTTVRSATTTKTGS